MTAELIDLAAVRAAREEAKKPPACPFPSQCRRGCFQADTAGRIPCDGSCDRP
jgi:hypothetical protein